MAPSPRSAQFWPFKSRLLAARGGAEIYNSKKKKTRSENANVADSMNPDPLTSRIPTVRLFRVIRTGLALDLKNNP